MNLLLVRTGGLGDCILTLPIASRLKELHPDALLHVLGNGAMLDVANLAGGFASLRSIDEAGFASLFSGAGPTEFLRSFFSRFDEVLFFTAADPAIIRRGVLASGARGCRVLDPRPPDGFHNHITTHLLTIFDEPPPELPLFPSITHENDLNRILIHPGSGSKGKTWPLDRFLAVAGRWSGEVMFLLGPAEEERGTANRIPGKWTKLRGLSVRDAAGEIASAGLFLGCDSGVSHLAALCGTPSVVLFGPTDPKVWRPLGERTTVIVSPDRTMEGIGVDEVFDALMQR